MLISVTEESVSSMEYRLEELKSLVTTMGADIVGSAMISLRSINPSTLIGKGKVEELAAMAAQCSSDCIVFDHDLAPRVQRNLEQLLQIAVIDRQEVILQIFSDRAATREAVLQIALARQEYSLPRLTRKWTHLSRQQGGAKGTRGEGEKQLEIDRRIVMKKISMLKSELQKVEKRRETQRKSRHGALIPTVAIVGYTNAGKSSLINALSGSTVLVEDKLFATLDPTSRRIELPRGGSVILSDTVGFVSNLPHHLVKAFSSTLEEASYDDIIIHLIDASHPNVLTCYKTTMEVLTSLGCAEKPMIVFINKMDAPSDEFSLAHIQAKHPDAILGSIKMGDGLPELVSAIEQKVHQEYPEMMYRIPHERSNLVALIRASGTVLAIDYRGDWVYIKAKVPRRLHTELQPFLHRD